MAAKLSSKLDEAVWVHIRSEEGKRDGGKVGIDDSLLESLQAVGVSVCSQ
jgi:hypothetical protein